MSKCQSNNNLNSNWKEIILPKKLFINLVKSPLEIKIPYKSDKIIALKKHQKFKYLIKISLISSKNDKI
jgi:hypothetical protein